MSIASAIKRRVLPKLSTAPDAPAVSIEACAVHPTGQMRLVIGTAPVEDGVKRWRRVAFERVNVDPEVVRLTERLAELESEYATAEQAREALRSATLTTRRSREGEKSP